MKILAKNMTVHTTLDKYVKDKNWKRPKFQVEGYVKNNLRKISMSKTLYYNTKNNLLFREKKIDDI